MFHWGLTSPERLKTTRLSTYLSYCEDSVELARMNKKPLKVVILDKTRCCLGMYEL